MSMGRRVQPAVCRKCTSPKANTRVPLVSRRLGTPYAGRGLPSARPALVFHRAWNVLQFNQSRFRTIWNMLQLARRALRRNWNTIRAAWSVLPSARILFLWLERCSGWSGLLSTQVGGRWRRGRVARVKGVCKRSAAVGSGGVRGEVDLGRGARHAPGTGLSGSAQP